MRAELPNRVGEWNDKVFSITESNFCETALDVFRFQYAYNSTYRLFSDSLGRNPTTVEAIEQLPFLPIRFFKNYQVKTTVFEPEVIFESSGTTGEHTSKHFVKSADTYRQSFLNGFQQVYGNIRDLVIIGLLPSYLERKNSSLVFMVNHLVELSGQPRADFTFTRTSGCARSFCSLKPGDRQPC